jgi:hypothetical protein
MKNDKKPKKDDLRGYYQNGKRAARFDAVVNLWDFNGTGVMNDPSRNLLANNPCSEA